MKNFAKRFISYLLIIVMVATVFVQAPVVASAEDTEAVLTYSVSDGVATITGIAENGNIIRIPAEYEGAPVARISAEGASKFHMSNTITAYIVDEDNQYFSSDENGVLYNYDKTELINYPTASLLTDFTTPASVKTIADYAFRGVINLQNVTLNEGIVNIGSFAFWTSNIVNISLPESLQTISKSAFWHSEKLTGINLPKNLISIGDAAFENCYSIEYFSVHPENTYFSSDEKGVLYNKNKSVLYQYPAGSTEIEFNIPLSVVIIKRGAFAYSENLRHVVLHNNIIEMETNVFQGSGIEYIDIPESLTAIPDYTFDDCGDLAAIAIHATITSVGVAAFRRCTSLKTVHLPDSITSIGKEAFRFSGIETITLPKGLTTIESSVFHYCENLISVEIPVSVTKIENAFYYGNNSLTDIYYHGTEEQWNAIDIVEGNTELEKVKINYNYINGTHLTSGDFEYTISDGSVTINKCVKSGYVAIVIPDEIDGYPVTEIAANAFRDSTVAEVKLPSGLKKIGMYAFFNCTLLTKIHLPDTLEVLEPYAFNKTRIERLNIPESLTHLEPGSFGLCEYLTFFEVDKDNPSYRNDENGVIFSKDGTVLVEYPEAKPEETYIVPDGVKEIGDSAFSNIYIKVLKNIVLPVGLEIIGDKAFFGYYESINLPDSLKKIGALAFYSCRFSSVEIPKGVELIGEKCFSSCSELTDVKINCEISEIPVEMFYLCKKLKTVNIPESVVSIGEEAFYGCESLTEIDLPDSVKSLGTRAFSDCKLLEKFDLPQGLTTLGEYVFYGCLHLTSITVDENNTAYSSDEYGVLFNKDKTKLIQYPMGNTRTSYEITDSVTSIGDYAFYNCNSLTSVTIGNSVTSIGNSAFRSCHKLTSITIPDSVTTIGSSAFYDCDSLTSIIIGNGVTSIGDEVFYSCDSLTSITIPD
ncbi:MAG: leucine-rich repeat domain-containing protein, partial [Acutalibacteraceae bacterium]|nr:leucine-rich repeat domain-containing protein [Acutalibacteraceae bacterium]